LNTDDAGAPVASTQAVVYPSHEKSSPVNSWTSQDITVWLHKHRLAHVASVYALLCVFARFVCLFCTLLIILHSLRDLVCSHCNAFPTVSKTSRKVSVTIFNTRWHTGSQKCVAKWVYH